MNIIETLKLAGIIPVIVIEKEEQAVPLAKALVKGGLPVLEVTFRMTSLLIADMIFQKAVSARARSRNEILPFLNSIRISSR